MCRANRLLALAVACLVWTGCGAGSTEEPDTDRNLRPANAPDFVLLTVSGHDGAISAVLCDSSTNESYLGDAGEAGPAVVDALVAQGNSVEWAHYTDRLESVDLDDDQVADWLGFTALIEDLQFIQREWIADFENPTKIILMGHSHGATWAHVATAALPEVAIDYLVTLDGICFLWECEHSQAVFDWISTTALVPVLDLSVPCDSVPVDGFDFDFNLKDVTLDHVRINLEVRSNDLFTSDSRTNRRQDGSVRGIETFEANETHNGVRLASSDSVAWVIDRILASSSGAGR